MRYLNIMLAMVGMIVLSACGPQAAETPAPPSGGQPTITTAAPATDEAYPAQPPTPTPVTAEEYPGPASNTPQPTSEPTAYPADKEVWVVRPLGQQCVDPATYEFADLDAAMQSLEEAGVEVLASEEVIRPVCQACDCSTSEHFRVQLLARDLAVAESLGWFQEFQQ